MQNTMGHDLINKSINNLGVVPKNVNIRELINEFYYFGHIWKGQLDKLTNYTHHMPIYKLIINENVYILYKISTYVVIQNLKIVNIDVYMCNIIPNELHLTSNYHNNIGIVEQYMLDESNKYKISTYKFKILENDGIFSVMDSNYNIMKHSGVIESSTTDGYIKSSVSIISLLDNFIIPSS